MLRMEQIAASNYHYRYHPFPLFVENQKKLGLTTVEIWGGSPHFYFDDETAAGVREARTLLDEAGLRAAVFTPESISYLYNLCAWEDQVRRKARKYYRQAIGAAEALGAGVMVLNCCGGAKDQPEETAYRHAVEGLQELSGWAAEKHIVLAVQTNCPDEGNIIQTLPQLRRLLKDVQADNVRPGLDVCAMGMANERLDMWFDAFGDTIAHIHFTDGKPAGRLVWGEGLHPLDDWAAALEAYGYTGTLGQLLTKEAYFFDPEQADRKNIAALAPYVAQEGGGR